MFYTAHARFLRIQKPVFPLKTPTRSIRSRAFTLIEVVLALGVVSTALVSLLGLMALAFTMLRESIDTTTHSQVMQSLSSEIEMLDYSEITGSPGYVGKFPRYYDEAGQIPTNPELRLYEVTVEVKSSAIPAAGGLALSTSSKKLNVTIKNLHNRFATREYGLWVVDNGR